MSGDLYLPGPPSPLGCPLVAVPGLGLSVDVPRRTLARLPAGTASHVVALPGYGEPARRGAALDPVSNAQRLLGRLDGMGVASAVLLGHSASCQIVAEAAARAPGRVAALVLAGPTTDPRAATWPGLAARWLRTAAHEQPWQVPQLVRDYRRTGLLTMGRAMDAARRHAIAQTLRSVRCPVLVVRGRRDRIAPADWVDRLAALVPDGRAATLSAGGHMVVLTRPDELAGLVGAFLHRVAPEGRHQQG